jgi:thiamine-phosphate pyrophosphorylase
MNAGERLLYRVIDANLNRLREGLRVCEEFVRFFSNDRELTGGFKRIRSRVSGIYSALLRQKKLLYEARDSSNDAGRAAFGFERRRQRLPDVFWANIQRSKESLRVLEEFFKLEKKELSDEFRRLRFKTYELEKRAYNKLKGLE